MWWNRATNRPPLLLKQRTHHGYFFVRLRTPDKKYKTQFVSRLVAAAFIAPIKPGLVVNHKDGDRTNNHVDNLEWCTQKENIHHAIRTGLTKFGRGEQIGVSKLKTKDVLEIHRRLKAGESQSSIARCFGVHQPQISRIMRGERWAHIKPDEVTIVTP
jgi:hypothetical protein